MVFYFATQNDYRRAIGHLLKRAGRVPVPAGGRLSLHQRQHRTVIDSRIKYNLIHLTKYIPI